MTPNLGQARGEVDGVLGLSMTSSAARPMTAHSGSSAGGDFALMQGQQVSLSSPIVIAGCDRSSIERDQQQTASSLGLRGRGYHPYAGGYSSRSHSVSTNGSSGRSSPVGFGLGHGHNSSVSSLASVGSSSGHDAVRGMMRMNLEQGSGVNVGMYRTDSPLSVQLMRPDTSGSMSSSHYGMELEEGPGVDVMGMQSMAHPRQMHPGMQGRQLSHPQMVHQQYQQYGGVDEHGYYASQEGVPAMM